MTTERQKDLKNVELSRQEAQNSDITPEEQRVWDALNSPTEEEIRKEYRELLKSLVAPIQGIQPIFSPRYYRKVWTLNGNRK